MKVESKTITQEQAQEMIRRLGILIVLLAPKLGGSNTRVDWQQMAALVEQAEQMAQHDLTRGAGKHG